MDFTREPIIETVITPKEGCKIVVRSSKNVGQEEYFVDALEVISFGHSLFFRSQEKPKAFLVPASDYEVLEVREARMVLKNVGLDRSIKIGGGKEPKAVKEIPHEKEVADTAPLAVSDTKEENTSDGNKQDKNLKRRNKQRRRRGREEIKENSLVGEDTEKENAEGVKSIDEVVASEKAPGVETTTPPVVPFSSLLPPPPMLISETISRYKENALFKNAFYTKEEPKEEVEVSVESKDETLQINSTEEKVEEKEESIVHHLPSEEHLPFSIESEPVIVPPTDLWGHDHDPISFPPLVFPESENKEKEDQ